MDCQYVKLIDADQPVDNPVRPMHDFANQGISEFWNCPTRFREWCQAIRRCNEAGNDDRRKVWKSY
jgi:hypothetical protein